MEFYNNKDLLDINKVVIPEYADPRHPGRMIKRTPKAQPGMSELVNIVAGLQKDVKRINQCLTKAGAEEYIAKNKKKNWYAFEGDITGPKGVPDGIPEVIVADRNGNIKIVNGYTLTKGTYPQRKLYRTLYPTVEARKTKPYTQFRKDLHEVKLDQNGFNPFYTLDRVEDDDPLYTKVKPSRVDPKQLFKQYIFGEVYEHFKSQVVHEMEDGTKQYDIPPMKLAELFNKAMNRSYELLVMDVVCAQMFNVPLVTIPSREARQKWLRKVIKKSNRDEAQGRAIGVILDIIHDNDRLGGAQAICDTIIGTIADRVVADQPEPDEDGFESMINPSQSGGSSPAASPSRVPLPPSSDDSV